MASSILFFDSDQVTLGTAGGKGVNLMRLARAGFPVPRGFIIATMAYRDYVNTNALDEKIVTTLAHGSADNLAGLETAASRIRQAFHAGTMPAELAREIVAAYHRLGQCAVAVRSSATTEDLPAVSSAGQHETYLNLSGENNLMRAVVSCWSSLWTPRAIGYRARHHLSPDRVALAVIVQTMAPGEASGVMFTANPLTGARDEIVIEATVGLGEAIVSGQVDPDNYIVDIARKTITTKTLGAKAFAIRGKAGGGTVTQDENVAQQQALPDAQIIELAKLGKQVADGFGAPQDIEWTWAGGRLFLLQTRPITTL